MIVDSIIEREIERCSIESLEAEQNERTYNLWMSVIEQAINDLSTPPRNKRTRINYKKAYIWFFGSDGDFEEVCSLINLDHRRILKSLEILKKYSCDA